MIDADEYLRQANALLSLSLATSNPVVAAKFWELAEDYLARAIKLRVDRGLSALPKAPRAVPSRPRQGRLLTRMLWSTLSRP
jgi:hypothetical protein